jgi:hypothetical protein
VITLAGIPNRRNTGGRKHLVVAREIRIARRPVAAVSSAHQKDIAWPTQRSDDRSIFPRWQFPSFGSRSLYSAWEPAPGTTSKSLLTPPSKTVRLRISV